MSATRKIAFLASPTADAQAALAAMTARHGQCAPDDADVVCALGGDGFMLHTLHRHGALGRPVFGMKLGTVGFLMNQFAEDGLLERLAAAEPAKLRPLEMQALTESGASVTSLTTPTISCHGPGLSLPSVRAWRTSWPTALFPPSTSLTNVSSTITTLRLSSISLAVNSRPATSGC